MSRPPTDRRLPVYLRHAAGRGQAPRGGPLRAAAQHPARRPRQTEPRTIPQHSLQPGRRHLARRAGAVSARAAARRIQFADRRDRFHRRRWHGAGCGGDPVDVRDGSDPAAQLGKVSLPLSGFRLRSHINSKKVWDEFLVFQGASYFRAVAKHLLYGLSARGLAINTAEPVRRGIPGIHAFLDRAARPRAPPRS